ncbi:MAG: hypothetical protein PHY93_21095 [Bacteriovorax sp.]|nr:hypothetical protein [Bacteriovorax sp.]
MIFLPIMLFILAAVAFLIGTFGVAAISIQAIQILAVVFLILGAISYIVKSSRERKRRIHQ